MAALASVLFASVASSAPIALAQDGHEAATAEHEGGEHAAPHLKVVELVAGFVNFAVLIGLLVFLARKPTQAFLVSRRAAVVDGLEEAQKMKAAAEAKYEEYQTRLSNLDLELAKIGAEIVASGEADRQAIIAEAERKASRLRRETEFLIEQQLKQLRVDLTKETVEAALLAAEKVLRERATSDDQQRLAKAYLTRLGPPAKTSSGSQGGAA
jgi:F-type H+-transporting ATPase subunit b